MSGVSKVETEVHDPRALKLFVDLVGVRRIALGSDYPFPLGEAVPGGMGAAMDDLDAEAKSRILHGTALEFLGVSPERFA